MLQHSQIIITLLLYRHNYSNNMDPQNQPTIDDLIKALPSTEKARVLGLKKLLDQRYQIDDEQEKNIQQIRVKYEAKIRPLLQRASQIIQGKPINPQQVANAKQNIKGGDDVQNFLKGKAIDGYWNGVFSNTGLVDDITSQDQKALNFLLDIQKVENNNENDLQSVELKFVFKPNPYFQQTEIKRKLVISGGIAMCTQGDKITWREGQCLTHQLKKVTNKKTGQKTTTLGEKTPSFFDIFLDFDEKDYDNLARVSNMMNEIASLVLLDSIDYFLGLINADEESDEEDEDEEGDEQK